MDASKNGKELREGYYWAKHTDGTTFVTLFEKGEFYVPGVDVPVSQTIRQRILYRIVEPGIN